MPDLTFHDLGLPENMANSIESFGYEIPSPIQAEAIPHLMQGRDIIGQAQTGTGKTAAFALPLLARIDIHVRRPQVLVLTPTRELAIQVAESFQKYARSLKGFHVLPIYGGQAYHHQLKPLQRGVHVVVGTPGRVTDHIRKGTLDLSEMTAFVLDEADEMLKMGFIEEVDWVLEQAPDERQIALFSATMPAQIQRLAKNYLTKPALVKVKVKTATAESINQRYQVISGRHKIDALTRVLDYEEGDAMLVFVRTKNASTIVTEQLEARGYEAMALNGDVAQAQREQIVQRLKDRKIDIIVATDVAARGLDVPRISHVINFDAPTDPEAYVHRIGRTGRAGEKGEAILFLTPREKRLLDLLSRSTKAEIKPMKMPSIDDINQQRVERFKESISAVIAEDKLSFFHRLMDSYLTENPEVDATQVAAALALMAQGDKPLLLDKRDTPKQEDFKSNKKSKPQRGEHGERRERGGPRDKKKPSKTTEKGMVTYRIEIGYNDEARPSAIVAAVCKASGLQGKHIGRINIFAGFSTIDLPEGMPQDIYQDLMRAKVGPKPMKISKFS